MVRPVVFWCCLLLASPPARADTFALTADEWFPYNGTPGAAREGYVVDVARAIAARGGDAIAYRVFDWETALARVRTGTDDCAIAANAADGVGLALSPEPIGRTVNAFFVRADSEWRYTGVDSLAAIRLATIAGYAYGDELDAWIARAPVERVVRVSNSRRALRHAFGLLLTEQVDALIDDELVVQALADRLGVRGRIVSAGRAPGALDLYLACAPTARGRALAQRFGAGVQALRDSGELAAILKRYGLQDWLLAK
jgi:polar amino acid transport system substrate-binding protein